MTEQQDKTPQTCFNCGRENSYIPGEGCPGCHWFDDEEQAQGRWWEDDRDEA